MCNCGKKRTVTTPIAPRSLIPTPSLPLVETFSTELWGPTLWYILHTLAEFTDRYHMSRFWYILLRNMRTLLPCPDCRAHFVAWVDAHPIVYTKSNTDFQGMRDAYRRWILALHNQVNVTKEAPTAPWTESQLTPMYGGDRTVRLQEVRDRITMMETAGYFDPRLIENLRKLVDIASRE